MREFSSNDVGGSSILGPAFVQLQASTNRCEDFGEDSNREAGPSTKAYLTSPTPSPRGLRRAVPLSRSPKYRPPPIDTRSSAPLERVPTEPMSSPPLIPDSPQQPTANKLRELYGIKVRDFAYESKLPPVPVVRKPPVRNLKAIRDLTAGGALVELSAEEQEARQRFEARRQEFMTARVRAPAIKEYQELSRKPTEPVIDVQPTRTMAFGDLTKWQPTFPSLSYSPTRGYHFPRILSRSPPHNVQAGPSSQFSQPFQFQLSQHTHEGSHSQPLEQYSQSQSVDCSQPPLLSVSQDSETNEATVVDTPLVTPYGSMSHIVLDTSALPERQIAPMQTNSQLPPGDDVSESQIGIPESQPSQFQSTPPNRQGDGEADGPASVLSVVQAGTPSIPFGGSLDTPHASPAPTAALTPKSAPPSLKRPRSGSSSFIRHENGRRKRSFSQSSRHAPGHGHEDGALLTAEERRRRNGPSFENEPIRPPISTSPSPVAKRYNLRNAGKAIAIDVPNVSSEPSSGTTTGASAPPNSPVLTRSRKGMGHAISTSCSSAHAAAEPRPKVRAKRRTNPRESAASSSEDAASGSTNAPAPRRSTRGRR